MQYSKSEDRDAALHELYETLRTLLYEIDDFGRAAPSSPVVVNFILASRAHRAVLERTQEHLLAAGYVWTGAGFEKKPG